MFVPCADLRTLLREACAILADGLNSGDWGPDDFAASVSPSLAEWWQTEQEAIKNERRATAAAALTKLTDEEQAALRALWGGK